MPIIKRKALHGDIGASLNYITQDNKTDNQTLVSSNNCGVATAKEEMEMVRRKFHQDTNDKNDRVGYHIIQSFALEDNLTFEQAHEIGVRLAKELYPQYQAVIATHVDRLHLHNHIIINSVNKENGKKLTDRLADQEEGLYALREASNRISSEYGCHQLEEVPITTYKKRDYSYKPSGLKNVLKTTMRKLLKITKNIEEFVNGLRNKGYQTRVKKEISVKPQQSDKFIRLDKLENESYKIENINKYYEMGNPKENGISLIEYMTESSYKNKLQTAQKEFDSANRINEQMFINAYHKDNHITNESIENKEDKENIEKTEKTEKTEKIEDNLAQAFDMFLKRNQDDISKKDEGKTASIVDDNDELYIIIHKQNVVEDSVDDEDKSFITIQLPDSNYAIRLPNDKIRRFKQNADYYIARYEFTKDIFQKDDAIEYVNIENTEEKNKDNNKVTPEKWKNVSDEHKNIWKNVLTMNERNFFRKYINEASKKESGQFSTTNNIYTLQKKLYTQFHLDDNEIIKAFDKKINQLHNANTIENENNEDDKESIENKENIDNINNDDNDKIRERYYNVQKNLMRNIIYQNDMTSIEEIGRKKFELTKEIHQFKNSINGIERKGKVYQEIKNSINEFIKYRNMPEIYQTITKSDKEKGVKVVQDAYEKEFINYYNAKKKLEQITGINNIKESDIKKLQAENNQAIKDLNRITARYNHYVHELQTLDEFTAMNDRIEQAEKTKKNNETSTHRIIPIKRPESVKERNDKVYAEVMGGGSRTYDIPANSIIYTQEVADDESIQSDTSAIIDEERMYTKSDIIGQERIEGKDIIHDIYYNEEPEDIENEIELEFE